MSKTQACGWYEKFKVKPTIIDNFPRSAHLSASIADENIEKFKDVILADRSVSISSGFWCLVPIGKERYARCFVHETS